MIQYNPLLDDILFWVQKRNETVNKFLLVGNKTYAKNTFKSDNVLRHKAFETACNSNYDESQRGLTSMVYQLFDRSTESGVNFMPNYQLANELHKRIIRELKKRKVYSSFKNNFGMLI